MFLIYLYWLSGCLLYFNAIMAFLLLKISSFIFWGNFCFCF